MTAIRVATRASALARTQSQAIANALSLRLGETVELVEIRTHGDADQTTPLALMGGVGVFVGDGVCVCVVVFLCGGVGFPRMRQRLMCE